MEDLWLRIQQQMEQRRQLGLKQYGVPVTSDTAVNWLGHLKEELLDAVVYTEAAIGVYRKYQQLLSAMATLTGLVEEEVEKKYAVLPATKSKN